MEVQIRAELKHAYEQAIRQVFTFEPYVIYSKSRYMRYVDARRFIMALLRTWHYSYKTIGSVFAFDHSTIIHHVQLHNDWIESDTAYKEKYESFCNWVNFYLLEQEKEVEA